MCVRESAGCMWGLLILLISLSLPTSALYVCLTSTLVFRTDLFLYNTRPERNSQDSILGENPLVPSTTWTPPVKISI